MIGTIGLIAFAIFIGAPLAGVRSVEPSRSGRLGLAYLIGTGVIAVTMGILGAVPGGWTRWVVLTVFVLEGAAGWIILGRWQRVPGADELPAPGRGSAILVIAAALVVGHALFATAAPPIEVDFLENWGLKGKLFWYHGGIDWHWLAADAILPNHADYPLLLPMLFDAAAVVGGGWDEGSLGLLFTAFAVAIVLVSEAALRREHPEKTIAVPIGVVALTPLALTPWIGLGEGPLIAYGAAAAHLLDRARERGAPAAATMAGVLLGFAALTKNEGMTLIVAGAVALAAARAPRLIARLWPAPALTALWIVPRAILGLRTDLAAGDPLARFLEQLAAPGELFASLGRYGVGKPLLWLGIAAALLYGGRGVFRRERLRLTLVATQFVFYLAAYLVTPHDLDWHVRWSWERLVSHLTFILAFAAISGVLIRMGSGAGGAEARRAAGEGEDLPTGP